MREKEFLPLVNERLGIASLNDMQRRMLDESTARREITLLAPTGTGKTLGFVLPVLKLLKPPSGRLQAVIIAPGRELAVQIYTIVRELARGYKVTALYGGHKTEDEINSLSVTPDIIVATPGRLLDHARRGNVDLRDVRILVLDEFDKSLELGFEEEMKKLWNRMKNLSRIIFTSATPLDQFPEFMRDVDPFVIDYLKHDREVKSRQKIHLVRSAEADKLESLHSLLSKLAEGGSIGRTIVFVNYRESAERVFDWLRKHGVECGIYHGNLDQHDREKAISLFNNNTTPVLVATDLAARGLDIEDTRHIIHYHLPLTPETWKHRNGRTARAGGEGDIYVMKGPKETLKEFVTSDDEYSIDGVERKAIAGVTATLRFSAGKKEKISRGDIVGFLVKEGGVEASAIGKIDVSDHYALVAVPADDINGLLKRLNAAKIKGKKVRVTLAQATAL